MSGIATALADHYTPENLLEAINRGLTQAGVDPEAPAPEDLKPVDEFHLGGVEATEAFLDPLGITAEMEVLDIGSGIGGTARFIAGRYGAQVTGVDLTPAFVATAKILSARVGLGRRTRFVEGSALALPVEAAAYDLATLFHVGMNIEDKAGLFREVARVLKPGGRFAVFDLMTRDGRPLDFPVPWSTAPETSFVTKPDAYRTAAEAAGLTPLAERDCYDYATAFFERVMAQAAKADGPPPVGLHLIMGATAQEKYGNAAAAVLDGRIGPREMVFGKG